MVAEAAAAGQPDARQVHGAQCVDGDAEQVGGGLGRDQQAVVADLAALGRGGRQLVQLPVPRGCAGLHQLEVAQPALETLALLGRDRPEGVHGGRRP